MVTVSVAAEGEPADIVRAQMRTHGRLAGTQPSCVALMFPATGASGVLCLLPESVETVEASGCLELEQAKHCVLWLAG